MTKSNQTKITAGISAKQFVEKLKTYRIEKLLESPIHEVQAGGCSIMGKQATSKKTPESRRKN